MEKDPSILKKVLEKRKKDDLDKKGIVSYLKVILSIIMLLRSLLKLILLLDENHEQDCG